MSKEWRTHKMKGYSLNQREDDPKAWRVNWRDSNDAYRRVRFEAADLETAIITARDIMDIPPEPGKHYNPEQRERTKAKTKEGAKVRISDAVIECVKHRNLAESTLNDHACYCRLLLKWMKKHMPVNYWRDLPVSMVDEYVAHLRGEGKSDRTIQLYLYPLRRANKWMMRCYGTRDLFVGFSLNKEQGEDDRVNTLTLHEVLSEIDSLVQSKRLDLATGVALQGICGLRVTEALRLHWEDLDLAAGTVNIHRGCKTRYSRRLIPVPGVVAFLLRRLRVDVRPMGPGEIPSERIFGHFSRYCAYGRALRRNGFTMPPKTLRKTLVTESMAGGWHGVFLERYVGHAADTVSKKHYFGDQIQFLLEQYREKVIPPVEQLISTWEAPAETGILPGPRQTAIPSP